MPQDRHIVGERWSNRVARLDRAESVLDGLATEATQIFTAMGSSEMPTMFVRHPVEDYADWRKVFDAFYEIRKEAGVTGEAVYRSVDDPNDVTLMMEFASIKEARAFPENEKLKGAYQQAHSLGPPTIWYAEKS